MPFIPKPIYNASHIDTDNNIYVPVICSYNVSGECRPLFFQFTEEDGSTNKIKIEKVEYSEKNSIFGTIYHCKIISNECSQIVKLYFLKDLNKWSLRL